MSNPVCKTCGCDMESLVCPGCGGTERVSKELYESDTEPPAKRTACFNVESGEQRFRVQESETVFIETSTPIEVKR